MPGCFGDMRTVKLDDPFGNGFNTVEPVANGKRPLEVVSNFQGVCICRSETWLGSRGRL